MRDAAFPPVLIVGGSAEARALWRRLGTATLILPPTVRDDPALPAPVGEITARRIAESGARAVIDASHPCDATTAFAVARAARVLDLPHLQLVRPPWRATPRDRWHRVRDAGAAARLLPEGARLFAATGREEMDDLRRLRLRVFLRTLSGPREPGRGRVRFVPGMPPFTAEGEARLFRRLGIDMLMVRNAGGPGGWPKLQAARRLSLPVAMIDRPRRPDGARAETPEEALQWLAERILSDG